MAVWCFSFGVFVQGFRLDCCFVPGCVGCVGLGWLCRRSIGVGGLGLLCLGVWCIVSVGALWGCFGVVWGVACGWSGCCSVGVLGFCFGWLVYGLYVVVV